MKLPPRVLFVTVVLGLTVAGASYACPTWPSDLGVDFWNVPALKDELARQNQFHAQLERQHAAVRQRIAVKEGIVGEVVAGRMGLLDAAARFHALNVGRADIMTLLRKAHPSASDEECTCRNVIRYVECYLRADNPDHPVLARLHAELEHWLAAGAGKLPDAPPSVGFVWIEAH